MLSDQSARRLHWDACYNVRDLGGYATADGGRTRWGAFVRADNLSRLTPAGQSALIAYDGERRITRFPTRSHRSVRAVN